MQFSWIDYPAGCGDEIDGWCDDVMVRFVLESDVAVAVLMFVIFRGKTKAHPAANMVCLDTLIVNPILCGQNLGARVVDLVYPASAAGRFLAYRNKL
ncbi:MAG: hypothetical protein FWC71_08540 [Defluviitaleaceae bacterium]|nr:hypothetical protein [Defluviitaleaceae bacterium]